MNLLLFSFQGDNVDCWMEIQQGKGPWASPVNGIVPLGTTLTMVVGIDDKEGKITVLQFQIFTIFHYYCYRIQITLFKSSLKDDSAEQRIVFKKILLFKTLAAFPTCQNQRR